MPLWQPLWHYAPFVLMVLSVLAMLLVLVVFVVLVWWCWSTGMFVGILGGTFVVLFDYGTMPPWHYATLPLWHYGT